MFKAIIKRLRKDQRGLTLIELLVVIVILGIIAAIAIPMVMSSQGDAKDNADIQNLNLVQDAVNRYMIDNDNVAPTTENLGNLAPNYLNGVPVMNSGCTFTVADTDTGVVTCP